MTENPNFSGHTSYETLNPLSRKEVQGNRLLFNSIMQALVMSKRLFSNSHLKEAVFTDTKNSLHDIIISQIYDMEETGYNKIVPETLFPTTPVLVFGTTNYRQPRNRELLQQFTFRGKKLPNFVRGSDDKSYVLQNIFLMNSHGQAVKFEVFREWPIHEARKVSLENIDFSPSDNDVNYARITEIDRRKIQNGLKGIVDGKFIEKY